jgi:hypothetical protein
MSGPALGHAAEQQRWLRYAGDFSRRACRTTIATCTPSVHRIAGASPIRRCLKVWQLNLVHARDRVLILRSK